MADLHTDIRFLKGIGEKKALLFHKLGIFTLGDCLEYFPRDYEDRSHILPIREGPVGENCCVRALVGSDPTTRLIRRGLTVTKLRAFDESGSMELTFFNQPYVKDQLRQGQEYVFYGRMGGNLLRKQMTNPEFEPAGKGAITGRILPVYRLTGGLSRKALLGAMGQALDCTAQMGDRLTDEFRARHRLCPLRDAYENIHFPQDAQALAAARRRVIFEEFFTFACGLQLMQEQDRYSPGVSLQWYDPQAFYRLLPFAPTGAQRRAVDQAFADLCSGRRMNRLIQGDVGSGKTLVAAACLWLAAKNDKQAALMAPTELLAVQHHQSLAPLLEQCGFSCGLLTGSTPKKQRQTLCDALAAGALPLVVGTHALLEQQVQFDRLALTITDEQHRFGVRQRQILAGKADQVHTLVMSATPIPRTLALLLYGDMAVSILDELPPGRKPVPTYAVDSRYRARLDAFLLKQVAAGGQAYIVCPLIETEEGAADERQSAVTYAQKLQQRLPQLRIGLMHGRLKAGEKDRVMASFAQGELDVLVSTTVIEVGVNVPRATLMIVEDADRFGLSQLHQLRGRVGRGTLQSYCVLVSDSQNEKTRRRLQVMTQCSDGFRIAEEDLKLRGPGDFFGDRQHGLPQFKVADLSNDIELLQEAQQAAKDLLAQDPGLLQHAPLRQRVEQLFARAQQ